MGSQERFAGCFTELADYVLNMRQNRSRHVVMNVDPWTSDRYQITHLGHCSKHRLIVANKKTDRPIIAKGTTTYLDVGMAKRQDEDMQGFGNQRYHTRSRRARMYLESHMGHSDIYMRYAAEETI